MRWSQIVGTWAVRCLILLTILALWAAPSRATVEWIGNYMGKAVYLIWANECSALDPPNDNVARVELTYTGPVQPGVFTDVVLYPPFDSFDTDGETYLTVYASTPMPMPCSTCFSYFVEFATTVPFVAPGEASPFEYVEYNANEGSCSGVAHRSDRLTQTPAVGAWGLMAIAGTLLALGAVCGVSRRRRATRRR